MKKRTVKKIVVAGILTASVILAGCYAKEKFTVNPPPSGKDLKKFASSVRKVDGQAVSHYKMALFFQKNRRHNLAIEELQKALQSDPAMARAYNAMGVSYDNLRQYDDAVKCYSAALEIDPKMDYAYNNLGYSHLLRGDNQQAIDAFLKAIEINGENHRYRNNLALAYVMNDQYDLASRQFAIIDKETDSEQKLAKLLLDLGKVKVGQHLAKSSENKDKSDITVAKKETVTPVVVKKKIELPSEPAQTSAPVMAAEETPVDKSAEEKPVEKVEKSKPEEVPSVEVQPAPEEQIEVTETAVAATEAQEDAEPAQSDHTTRWVAWEESEPAKAGDSSQATQASPLPADFPTNPLHVSAVQIAAGKATEPVVEEQAPQQALVEQSQTAPKAAPRPKIIEVDQVGEAPLMKKQIYEVKPVSAVVLVSADTTSSSKQASPADATAASVEKTQEAPTVIHVAAVEPVETPKAAEVIQAKLPPEAVEVELEIANGNGENGMARKVAKYLEIRGFKVAEITNAHSFDHELSTVLYSSEGRRDLERLMAELHVIRQASNLIELEHLGNRIRVVVGKDMLSIQDELAANKTR